MVKIWLLRYYIRKYRYDYWFHDDVGKKYSSRPAQIAGLVEHIEDYGFDRGLDFAYDYERDY